MSDFSQSPIAKLEARGLIVSPVFKGPTTKPGRFGFRGDLALKLASSTAGEKRPPEVKTEQVLMTTEGDRITFFACFVDSLGHLGLIADVLGEYIDSKGKYFVFAGNVDLLKKYDVDLACMHYLALPLDEATVYNEMLDLLYLEKGDLKRKDPGAKLDAIADAAIAFKAGTMFKPVSFEEAVKEMGPVKVIENRPV